eukprot:3389120-Pyramimonas_sp.AAC.1
MTTICPIWCDARAEFGTGRQVRVPDQCRDALGLGARIRRRSVPIPPRSGRAGFGEEAGVEVVLVSGAPGRLAFTSKSDGASGNLLAVRQPRGPDRWPAVWIRHLGGFL